MSKEGERKVTTSCSPQAIVDETHENKAEAQKKLVEQLKVPMEAHVERTF